MKKKKIQLEIFGDFFKEKEEAERNIKTIM